MIGTAESFLVKLLMLQIKCGRSPPERYKNPENNGISTTNLNWWVHRISSPSCRSGSNLVRSSWLWSFYYMQLMVPCCRAFSRHIIGSGGFSGGFFFFGGNNNCQIFVRILKTKKRRPCHQLQTTNPKAASFISIENWKICEAIWKWFLQQPWIIGTAPEVSHSFTWNWWETKIRNLLF